MLIKVATLHMKMHSSQQLNAFNFLPSQLQVVSTVQLTIQWTIAANTESFPSKVISNADLRQCNKLSFLCSLLKQFTISLK